MDSLDTRLIDLAPYRTMSVLTTRGTLSVARALVERGPGDLPDYVQASRARLVATLEAADEAMDARSEQSGDPALERQFDLFVDQIWAALRTRLEHWRLYAHPGALMLDDEEREALDMEDKIELAKTAETILARMFGDGLAFLRLSYPEQAEHMLERLRYLDNEGLADTFAELVGEQPLALARVCQRRYDAMVRDRHGRRSGVSVNLRLIGVQVRRAVDDYANLLLSTIHGADEGWVRQVFASLEPMRSGPPSIKRGDAGAQEGEDVDEGAGPEGAEAQAVEERLDQG